MTRKEVDPVRIHSIQAGLENYSIKTEESTSGINDESAELLMETNGALVTSAIELSTVIQSLNAYLDNVATHFETMDNKLAGEFGTLEIVPIHKYRRQESESQKNRAEKYVKSAKTPEQRYIRSKNLEMLKNELP